MAGEVILSFRHDPLEVIQCHGADPEIGPTRIADDPGSVLSVASR